MAKRARRSSYNEDKLLGAIKESSPRRQTYVPWDMKVMAQRSGDRREVFLEANEAAKRLRRAANFKIGNLLEEGELADESPSTRPSSAAITRANEAPDPMSRATNKSYMDEQQYMAGKGLTPGENEYHANQLNVQIEGHIQECERLRAIRKSMEADVEALRKTAWKQNTDAGGRELDTTVTLKLCLVPRLGRCEVRRLKVESNIIVNGYVHFTEVLRKQFLQLLHCKFRLNYEDDEGDLVTIRSDIELAEACRILGTREKAIYKFIVHYPVGVRRRI